MKAIFFDLDGTLTDSGEGIMNCAAVAFQHLQLPVPDRQALRVFVGPPLDDSFLRFGVPKEKVWEAITAFRARYAVKGKFENFPYEGIPQVLKKLQDMGYPLYVATSKPETLAKEVMTHFGLTLYFEAICGATMDGSRSTKEDVITYLLEQIGGADDPIMVGDTVYDVLGAAAHQIPAVGVAWGYGSPEEMKKAGAIAIAYTPAELLNLIKKEQAL